MNEIQILSNYNPFLITGIVLSVLWAGAYVLSWIIQWAWAWVDESKVGSYNALIKKLFPLDIREYHNATCEERKNGWFTGYYGKEYTKFVDSDRVGYTNIYPSGFKYLIILPLIWFSMLCLNFWWISMWFAMAFTLAFTMRMARRGQKLLKAHINDKDAHKDVSE